MLKLIKGLAPSGVARNRNGDVYHLRWDLQFTN
jgi:hypothetical protein